MVLSVFDEAQLVLQSIKAGASGYLLKDSLPGEIGALIRQLRSGGAPMTPSIARLVLGGIRPPAAQPTLAAFHLTPAEQTVLQHVARGFKYAEVAQLCGTSIHTVHTHIKNIYAKLTPTNFIITNGRR